MKTNKFLIRLAQLAIVLAILTMGMIYPFLSGEYDSLAMPLSIIIQGVGVAGLLLSVTGIFWFIIPGKFRFFAKTSVYLASVLTLIFTFLAYLLAGIVFGVFLFAIFAMIVLRMNKTLNKHIREESFSFVPVSMIAIPLYLLIIQLIIAKPITDQSRERTITNAGEYIQDIESFQSKYGYYPKAIQAMYKDYHPQTIGVEKFHYLPCNHSYNISFEQPRFLLDRIGTREWVVYNPKDEQRVYSHTSWFLLLPPEESEIQQGWYSSENTGIKHWKSFLFD